jgi:hypothetical protein
VPAAGGRRKLRVPETEQARTADYSPRFGPAMPTPGVTWPYHSRAADVLAGTGRHGTVCLGRQVLDPSVPVLNGAQSALSPASTSRQCGERGYFGNAPVILRKNACSLWKKAVSGKNM